MVPFMIPSTRRIGSARSDSRSGRMNGMPPATAASKSRSTPASCAAAYSSAPQAARSALLAVTTGLPSASAASTSARAGSTPPMTSTMTSTDGSVAIAMASSVRTPSGSDNLRERARSRTATRVTSTVRPVRMAMVLRCRSRRARSDEPTVPQPSRPTRTEESFTGERLPGSQRCEERVRGQEVMAPTSVTTAVAESRTMTSRRNCTGSTLGRNREPR